jgi:hypothetical protein
MLPSIAVGLAPRSSASDEVRDFVRRAASFLLIGVALYAVAYAGAEALVYRYGHRNRFFAVRSIPPSQFDYVVLGASHAAVLDYRDMNRELERLTGARIMNLSVVGGGVAVNALLLEYFLSRHQTHRVVYMVDSFAFYSAEWNELRLQDTRLFARAPFDPALVVRLLESPAAPAVAIDYALGFSKINNRDRFAPDTSPDEGSRFDRRYRPVPQVDEERLAYLYPREIDAQIFENYLAQLQNMIRAAHRRGIELIVVKPPMPERIRRLLPGEPQFDAALKGVLDRDGVEFHDFSGVASDERFFQDSDHLNRAGVLEFFHAALAPLLIRKLRHHM